MTEANISEFQELTEVQTLRRAVRTLERQLRRAKAKSDDLVEASFQGAHTAMLGAGLPAPVKAPEPSRRTKKAEVALWHLTDWQGAKVTTSYNSDVMRERVMRYCVKVQQFTEIQRADHPVKDATIMFGGDLMEGLFNYPAQPFEIDGSLFEQHTNVALLVADVVRFALSVYNQVHVIAEWGNHGRIGSKRAAVPRSDNFDRIIMQLARALLQNEKRLTWQASDEDTQNVQIGNYRALLFHGDEVGRNGYASPMTIVSHVARWQSGSHSWPFTDAYLGHYHSHNEWALPSGSGAVYQTGSPESDNRYAGVHMAASSRPSQRLHFIDPVEGMVTSQWKVWLDR